MHKPQRTDFGPVPISSPVPGLPRGISGTTLLGLLAGKKRNVPHLADIVTAFVIPKTLDQDLGIIVWKEEVPPCLDWKLPGGGRTKPKSERWRAYERLVETICPHTPTPTPPSSARAPSSSSQGSSNFPSMVSDMVTRPIPFAPPPPRQSTNHTTLGRPHGPTGPPPPMGRHVSVRNTAWQSTDVNVNTLLGRVDTLESQVQEMHGMLYHLYSRSIGNGSDTPYPEGSQVGAWDGSPQPSRHHA